MTRLVRATIAEIGEAGSLDVTVSQIAKRAGMSSALAHHYFGGKDQIFEAAMRQILTRLRCRSARGLGGARTLRARPRHHSAPVSPNPALLPQPSSAWMTFYAQAQTNPDALRLLQLYQRRLRSNLTHALRPICDAPRRWLIRSPP